MSQTVDLETRYSAIALDTIATIVQEWLDWNTKARAEEKLWTDPDTNIMSLPVPYWPDHSMLQNWVKALRGQATDFGPLTPPGLSLADELASLRAQLVELTKERDALDEWKAAIIDLCKALGSDAMHWGGDKTGWGFIHFFVKHLHTRAERAEASLATAYEALEPFAKAAKLFEPDENNVSGGEDDDELLVNTIYSGVTLLHLRIAAALRSRTLANGGKSE